MADSNRNPYVGPRTFEREEAALFFGRDREAETLMALVASERLVLFYAQSGAGKSSLIRTRLIPGLEEIGFVVLPLGRVGGELPASVSQVDNIFAFNLMLGLAANETKPARLANLSLAHFLARLVSPDGQIYTYDEHFTPATSVEVYEEAAHVLIIDQFEEIATAHLERWSERADFFRQLDQAMAADPLLWIVLSAREDYVAALDPYASLLAGKLQARFYMERMGRQAALEAIKNPAQAYGRPFAEGVAESLVDNLRQVKVQDQTEPQLGQYVEPVQLQVVCYQLWQNLQERHPDLPGFQNLAGLSSQITAADLATLGNVDTALAEYYEQTLRVAGPEVSELALRRWFNDELITEAGTRGVVFQGPHHTAGLPNTVVKHLADHYLLRAEPRAGGIWVELVHDGFVEPIQQANRAWEAARLQRDPLAASAVAWQHDPAKLLEGAQLRAAAQYAEANPQDVTAEEQEFLQESLRREAEQAQKARATTLRRRIYAGVALAVIIALALLANWGWQSAITLAAQNEKTQAELNFYQTTDLQARLDELHKLFNQSDPGSQAKARQLFFSLPKVDQLLLFRVADTPLITVSRALLPNLADVNRTGYTDEHLLVLLDTLPGLPAAGDLPTRLEAWLAARKTARKGQLEEARKGYDELIQPGGDTPALFYERAGVLAVLGENQAALADLEQVITLAQTRAYITAGTLPVESEFASRERMIKAVRRLITVNPALAGVFKNTPTDYPRLGGVGLAPEPEVITDTKGITMVLVPAGTFKMGSTAHSTEQPVHQVDLDEFYIDQYEVTNAQYAAFLREHGNQEEGGVNWLTTNMSRLSGDGKTWQIAAGYDNHPVTGVSWYGAKAYCAWRGEWQGLKIRLPTEAEWEKAARGDDQRTYPWGEQISCDLANYRPPNKACVGDTSQVGDYPAGVSPYGAYNMAGNVSEWVADWYDDNYYSQSPDRNPPGPKAGERKALRGGSWVAGVDLARATYRTNKYVPDYPFNSFGFRCAGAAAP